MGRRPDPEAARRVLRGGSPAGTPRACDRPTHPRRGSARPAPPASGAARTSSCRLDEQRRQAVALRAGPAREQLVLLHSLEEEMGVVGPGEPDATVQLDVVTRDPHARRRRRSSRPWPQPVPAPVTRCPTPRRRTGNRPVPSRPAGTSRPADGAPSGTWRRACRRRSAPTCRRSPRSAPDGPRRRSPPPARRRCRPGPVATVPSWLPDGPRGTTGVSSRTSRASLRVGSSDGTSVAPGSSSRYERTPSSLPRHHDGPVRRVPVDHDRLLAAQDPLRRPAARPCPHGLDGVAVSLLTERHGAPAGAGGQVAQERRVAPNARAARMAATEDEKNGPGQRRCDPSPRGRRTFRAARHRCRRTPRARAGPSSPGRPASTTTPASCPRPPRPAGAPRLGRTRAPARHVPLPAARAARRRT